jgi:hypothetical protein
LVPRPSGSPAINLEQWIVDVGTSWTSKSPAGLTERGFALGKFEWLCFGCRGLLPHRPHNLRDILATHILKQAGSYGQATYAIQDTPDVV